MTEWSGALFIIATHPLKTAGAKQCSPLAAGAAAEWLLGSLLQLLAQRSHCIAGCDPWDDVFGDPQEAHRLHN